MNRIKVLAALVFLILRPVVALVENDTYSTALVTLTGDNFDESLEKNSLMVMFYYAECYKCNELSKLWETLARTIIESEYQGISIGKVDCSLEIDICEAECRTISNTETEVLGTGPKCVFPSYSHKYKKYVAYAQDRCIKDHKVDKYVCSTNDSSVDSWEIKQKICGRSCPKSSACNGATHQELILEDAGADATDTTLEVETTYSGSTELEKDIDCCSKCNLKDECDFWVRATDSNGCWLKLANGKRIKHVSSSNRRGGMRKTMSTDLYYTKLLGKSCQSIGRYDNFMKPYQSILEAKEACFRDKQCKGVHSQDCNDSPTIQLCYLGHGYEPSLTSCVYEKMGKPETFIKEKRKICASPYQSEKSLESAIETCNLNEDCNMFYNLDCSNKGPFRLCNSTSSILDSDGDNCAYLKIKEEEVWSNCEDRQKQTEVTCMTTWLSMEPCDQNQIGPSHCSPLTDYYCYCNTNHFTKDGKTCIPCPSQPETCSDGIRNNHEIAIDCGGPYCKSCDRCSPDFCQNGGHCFISHENRQSCTCPKTCNGTRCEHCSRVGPRYKFNLEAPNLIFFKKASSQTLRYLGPENEQDLLSFVKEQIYGENTSIKSESDLMLQAGCKKKKWIHNDHGDVQYYKYVASGKLLDEGVCIDDNYHKEFAPSQEKTKIHSTIEYQTVRNVDAKDQTLSFDLILTLKWLDPFIHTYFTEKDKKNKGIVLSKDAYDKIWSPDLFVWNRTSVTSTDRWLSLVECKILTTTAINEQENKRNVTNQIQKTTVEMRYVIKTTVYCKFQYAKYPMDTQNCSVKIGSSSHSAIFTLFDERHLYHTPKEYDSVGLKMQVTFLGSNNKFGNDTVGFQVQMSRLLRPYLMMYYIPCIAIVLVSELGFLVRLTADGSVGLLVTQLLTLVNLFIYQMSESPSASDMNILGQYLIVSLGFVVGAVIEFAIINHLNTTREGEQKDENNRVFPEQDNGNKNYKKNSQNKLKKKNKFNFTFSFSSMNRFDLGAFLIHFLSFLLFNVVYWCQNFN